MPKKVIHMRVDEELKDAARSEALLMHVDLSAFVSIALSEAIDRRRLERKRAQLSAERDIKR